MAERARLSHRFSEEAPGGGLLARLYTRTSLTLLGVVALALVAGMLTLTIGVFTHAFSDPATVSLRLDRAGSQLSKGADVKVNGLIVGRVSGIQAEADGSGATLTLAIDRRFLDLIPANISATVTPKTLFGEKYVDLEMPAHPDAVTLADGATIERDRSSVSIETSTVLNDLGPLLDAVDPADLNRTLTAVATALDGRGTALGTTIGDAARFTGQVRPAIADLVADAGLLTDVAGSYTRASTPIVRTLKNVGVSARTLTAMEPRLVRLLTSSQRFARITGDLIQQVGPDMIKLVHVSRPVLDLLEKYSPELACTIRGVVQAKDRLEAVFADGPYLKARLYVATSRGTYKYPQDLPKDLDLSAYGPQCPITPKDGKGTVPWPVIPHELDGIRGKPQPLETVNGLPDLSGLTVDLGTPGASSPAGTSSGAPTDLLGLLLGGVLG